MIRNSPYCVLYVIGANTGPQKVGVTRNLDSRLRSLQTHCPYKLAVKYSAVFTEQEAYAVEAAAHERLADKQTSGEWFSVSPKQIVEIVQAILKATGIREVVMETAETAARRTLPHMARNHSEGLAETQETPTWCSGITPSQSRMARACLKWNLSDVASKAGIGKNTMMNFEDEEYGNPRRKIGILIEHAYRSAGIEFPDPDTVRYRPKE